MPRFVSSNSAPILLASLACLALFSLPRAAAQTRARPLPDTREIKDFTYTGVLTVKIQDVAGAPFFQGAKVTLFTRGIDATLVMTSDASGRAKFTALPVGHYTMEITAAGYRAVQQLIQIFGTREQQDIVVSMVPMPSDTKGAKIKVGAASVSPKALKESEKALHCLQLNQLDEAHLHLERALVLDPNFADADYLMGVLLLRQKDPARAAAYLDKSLAISPDQGPALLALGQAQYVQQDFPHATESLEKFVREHPHDPQVPIAQKYVDTMQKFGQANAPGGTQFAALGADASQLTFSNPNAGAGSSPRAATNLPPLVDDSTATEANNWAPPNVDDEKLALDTTAPCQLDDVVHSASQRIQELVQNVARFTATENVEHTSLSPMGFRIFTEHRKFNYLVEMHPVGTTDLSVEEYRNGSDAERQFPEGIVTVGLPALALILHPNLQRRYDFQCQGRGSWEGKPVWIVRFQQRPGSNNGMLVYQVSGRSVAVSLKGRAWIDASSSQILAMESDIVNPAPEIRLFRDHQLIEYGPVAFRNKSMELWLPKSADWYCAIGSRHIHRRHTLTQFLLFSVDEKQKISAPAEPAASENPH
jgi:tetratricopeptide (TPR) repeat protein